MLVSVLLAFILAPVMDAFIRFRLPRGLAAAVAVILFTHAPGRTRLLLIEQAIISVAIYPRTRRRFSRRFLTVRQRAENLEHSTRRDNRKTRTPSQCSLEELLTRGFWFGFSSRAAASFVPFLVYSC